MYRLRLAVLMAVAVVLLPQAVLAQGEPAPARPGVEILFQHLDADRDGKITGEEIPGRAPEVLKGVLKRADRNEDGAITAEEFAVAVNRLHPGAPARRSRTSGRPMAASRRPGPPRPFPAGPPWGPRHWQPRGWDSVARQPFALGGPRPRMPDPKTLFARIDRDKDGKLSLEEFTSGVRALHAPGRPPFAGPSRLPMFWRPPGPPRPSIFWHHPGPPRAPGARPPRLLGAEAFKRVDANKDGKVTLDEVPSHRQAHFKRFLARADKDGDKALSADEARKAAEAIRATVARRAEEVRRKVIRARMAASARRSAALKRSAEASKRGPAARQAAPSRRKPPGAETTPQARKKAAEANRAAARKAAEARKKQAEVRRKAAEAARKRVEKAPAQE